MERVMGLEPTNSAWKANVLPLHYTRKISCYGAGDGARTRHRRLGKAALYQMSYSRKLPYVLVRAKRLELICPAAPEPKSGASANSATPANPIEHAGDPSETQLRTLCKRQVLYHLG